MRLNPRDIEREIDESIADGTTLTGSRSSPEIRVRKPPASRGGHNAAKRDRGSRRPREEATEEGSL